jgi:hypothetical protein
MDISVIKDWKSIYVPVVCPAGQTEISIGFQEYLKDKCIKAVLQTGNAVGRNNQSITKTNFWIDLKVGMDTLLSLSADMLNFNQNNLIIIDKFNIDFQNSKIVFPTALLANTTVELIIFYMDTAENPY